MLLRHGDIAMALLSVKNLKKEFIDRILFEGLSFDIEPKDKIGFIGVNGCGKTTLFRILLGDEPYDEGSIAISRGTVIGSMKQHVTNEDTCLFDSILEVFSDLIELEEELRTISERLEAGDSTCEELIKRQSILSERFQNDGGLTFRSRARSAALGLGFTEDELKRPLSTFSGGQKNKAQLARMLLCDAGLLLLDEPTNHLDIKSVEWLEDFLKNYGKALIVISHDRYFLDRVTNKTMELKNGKLFISNGNYSEHIKRRESAREIAIKHYLHTKREIRRIENIVEQQRRWGQERNFVTAASKQKQIERLKNTLVEPERDPDHIRFGFMAKEISGNDVVIADNLKKSFDGRTVFENVSFYIRKGERIFLIGANGCGKTTLLRMLVGELKPDGGRYALGAKVKPGFYDQTLSGLSPEKTVLSEAWDDHYAGLTHKQIRNALGAFLFRGDDVNKFVSSLSGGEKARLQLLKLMLSESNFLLLDEPTNHLDIDSREMLERALEEYTGTLLIVTHDRYLINRLADRILVIDRNGLSEYVGSYDEYIDGKREVPSPMQHALTAASASKQEYLKNKERQSKLNRLNGEIARTEAAISEIEGKIADINRQLALESVSIDYVKVAELAFQAEKLNEELESRYEVWEDLQFRLSNMEE